MTADDKLGLGVGALALGLAGGIILLAQLLPGGFLLLPHRELVMPEAIFDGIVFFLGVPAGIYLFYQGIRSQPRNS
jgi:hypothetical protein